MYRWIVGLALLIACFVAVVVFVRLPRTSAPESHQKQGLADATIEHDFGTVISGQEVKHTFHIPNTTSAPLKVVAVRPSCSCTTLGDLPTSIPLHGADLSVSLHTNGMNASVKRSIIVELVGSPPVQLVLAGAVLESCPASVQFGQIRRGERLKRSFKTLTASAQPGIVSTVEYDRTLLEVQLHVVNPTTTEVIVETSSTIPDGPFNIPLTMRISGQEEMHYHTRIQGYVLRNVEADKDRVFLSPSKNGNLTGELRLFSPYGHPFSLKNCTSSDPHNLIVTPSDSSSPESVNLEVRYRLDANRTSSSEFVNGTITAEVEADGVRSTKEIIVFGLTGVQPSRLPQ